MSVTEEAVVGKPGEGPVPGLAHVLLLIWFGVGVALVAAYAAAGFFLVPYLLRSSLTDFAAEHYGRSVAIGEIRFNPFTLTLEMTDFSFPDADSQPMFGFGRLLVDGDVATLWRRGLSLREIDLERPVARVLVKSDGALNLSALAAPFAEPESAPVPAAASEDAKPMRLFIDRLRVLEGRVSLEDRTHSEPFRAEVRPITFALRDFSTIGSTGNAYALAGTSAAGEEFHWTGTVGVAPLASQGSFEVAHLRATTIADYLRESLPFETASGIVELDGDYEFTSATQPFTLRVNVHEVAAEDLGVRPRGGESDYVHLARCEIDATRLDVAKRSVEIGPVRLTGGEVRAWIDEQGGINLLQLLARSSTEAAGAGVPASDGAATSTPQTTNQPEPASAAWTLAAPDIAMDGIKVSVEDRRVDIGLPVTGSLDDPKFRLGPIIWKAVVGLLTKIVTAPFALLGRLFGGGEEMNLIDFEPGNESLDPAGQEKLAGVVKALQERPQLQLDVPITFAADLDRPVLEARALETKLLALKAGEVAKGKRSDEPMDATLLADPAEHFRLLVKQFRAELGKDAELPPAALAIESTRKKPEDPAGYEAGIHELEAALTARSPVQEADLDALGKARARAIQDVLLGGGAIEPSRVFIIGATSKAGVDGKVRVEMSLK